MRGCQRASARSPILATTWKTTTPSRCIDLFPKSIGSTLRACRRVDVFLRVELVGDIILRLCAGERPKTPKRMSDRELSFVHVEILSRATEVMRKIVKALFRHLDAAEVHLSGDECGSADDVVVNPLSGAVGSTWAESEVIHRKGATDPGPALVRYSTLAARGVVPKSRLPMSATRSRLPQNRRPPVLSRA